MVEPVEHDRQPGRAACLKDILRIKEAIVVLHHEPPPHRFGQRRRDPDEPIDRRLWGAPVEPAEVQDSSRVAAVTIASCGEFNTVY